MVIRYSFDMNCAGCGIDFAYKAAALRVRNALDQGVEQSLGLTNAAFAYAYFPVPAMGRGARLLIADRPKSPSAIWHPGPMSDSSSR